MSSCLKSSVQSEDFDAYTCRHHRRSYCRHRCRRRRRHFHRVILTFYLPFAIDRYLSIHGPPASNDIILTPKSINPAADESKIIEEFKLYSE